jgi:hypothetical protein
VFQVVAFWRGVLAHGFLFAVQLLDGDVIAPTTGTATFELRFMLENANHAIVLFREIFLAAELRQRPCWWGLSIDQCAYNRLVITSAKLNNGKD